MTPAGHRTGTAVTSSASDPASPAKFALGLIVPGLGFAVMIGVEQMPALYTQIVLTSVGLGVVLLLFARPLRRLVGGVR